MIQKKIYTKELGEKVALRAKAKDGKEYHVIRSDGEKWAVFAHGDKEASKVFQEKSKAIAYAEKAADKQQSKVVVHSKTGEVEDAVSFF